MNSHLTQRTLKHSPIVECAENVQSSYVVQCEYELCHIPTFNLFLWLHSIQFLCHRVQVAFCKLLQKTKHEYFMHTHIILVFSVFLCKLLTIKSVILYTHWINIADLFYGHNFVEISQHRTMDFLWYKDKFLAEGACGEIWLYRKKVSWQMTCVSTSWQKLNKFSFCMLIYLEPV